MGGRPTDRTNQVFNEFNAQLQIWLQNLRTDVSTIVPGFNQLIQQGLAPISCSAM